MKLPPEIEIKELKALVKRHENRIEALLAVIEMNKK